MSLLKIAVTVCMFGFANLVSAQERIVIDTVEDLYNMPGWIVTCDRGYQANTEDYACHNRLKVEIPPEDLRGEVGFWTGCQVDCILTYTLRSTDVGMGFRAYAKGAHVTVIKNDLVREEIQGDKWMDVSLDLNFTRTVGIKLPLIAQDVFAVLDKIYIIPQQPTTKPTEPTEPTVPNSPSTEPTEPTEPTVPTSPSTEPTEQTEPTVPTSPSTEPTEPTEPTVPTSPSTEPTEQTEPTVPTSPSTEPTEQTEPTVPTSPSTEPTEPTEPTVPTRPSTEPTEPTESTVPTSPSNEPTEPTEPTVPTPPSTEPTEPTSLQFQPHQVQNGTKSHLKRIR